MPETEPADQTMSTSKDGAKIEERRSSPRETLRRYVVLVFFGEDNWGKLTNMSESGMAFEFAKPPSLRERVTFTFQAMGSLPTPRNGNAPDSFEVRGEIVWTREFERGAGVQFVDVAEASREQIRQWLETSKNSSEPAEPVKPEAQPTLAELLSPFGPQSSSQGAPADKKESLLESDMSLSLPEPVPEPDSAFRESSVAEQSHEPPPWSYREETGKQPRAQQLPGHSHPSVARLTFLVVSGCLAAFAVTAGVRIFMARAAHRAEAEVRASDSPPGTGEPAAAVNVSSPVASPVVSPAPLVTSSSPISAPPFQVDVLDASGRNWILWFVHGGAKNKESQPFSRPAGSSNSAARTMKTTKREEATSPEKLQEAHTFTMSAPNVSHPAESSSPGKPSADAPTIQPELAPTLGGPIGGVLVSHVAPAAPAHGPIGGMVQQPRLLRSAPAVYPQLAKSSRVSGDVVVDALIDTSGNVTTAKVISGPVLLQQAAVETVRHWKYEPARLDGQAVAMHLTVTVRFRLN